MKLCAHCGCINLDRAVQCRKCESNLTETAPVRAPQTASLSYNIYLLAVAWVASLLAILVISGFDRASLLSFPVLTPVGVAVLYLCHGDGIFGSAMVGWGYYLILTLWTLLAKQRRTSMTAYAILVASLLFNIVGCEALKHGKWTTEKFVPLTAGVDCQAKLNYKAGQAPQKHAAAPLLTTSLSIRTGPAMLATLFAPQMPGKDSANSARPLSRPPPAHCRTSTTAHAKTPA